MFTATASGSAIKQNCTYIRNPGYPSALTKEDAITYTVKKVDKSKSLWFKINEYVSDFSIRVTNPSHCSIGVCYLRLDFMSFTILGTVGVVEANGGACADSFVVTVSRE